MFVGEELIAKLTLKINYVVTLLYRFLISTSWNRLDLQ